MSSAVWPLQQAVYAKVNADAAFAALARLYDEVPETARMPYVTFGSITETTADSHSERGLTVALVLHIWSAYRGTKEAADILAALDAVLDRKPLAVTGWRDISVAMESAQTVRDPDPDIRHINARYRVWMNREGE